MTNPLLFVNLNRHSATFCFKPAPSLIPPGPLIGKLHSSEKCWRLDQSASDFPLADNRMFNNKQLKHNLWLKTGIVLVGSDFDLFWLPGLFFHDLSASRESEHPPCPTEHFEGCLLAV